MAMVEPVLKEDGTPYKVAILIPTINNADELAIVLDRLTQQTYPDIEIVISDSKSRDHTKDVCEKYGATWIEDPSTNRADACNFALRQMDHDLVLFTDFFRYLQAMLFKYASFNPTSGITIKLD